MVSVNVGDSVPMPADGAIQIAFDRYLLPATVTRQAVVLLDGARKPVAANLAPIVLYDPVARTVTLAAPRQPWLTEGQPYSVLLPIPEGDSDATGLRAIDRATLYPQQKLEFGFFVGPKRGTPIEPTVSFCRDVLPIFTAKCSVPTCHGSGDSAAASLVLDTSAGVGATALNRVAQGSNTGPRAGLTTTSEKKFGVDMPIIDPGHPANSWLMYKVEMAPQPAPVASTPKYACTNGLLETNVKFVFASLAPNAQRAADDVERTLLYNYILGREMPFPALSAGGYEDLPLTFDEREKIRLWIQDLPAGATVPECGGCGVVPDSDAGAGDAGVTDAADQ